MEKKVEQTSTSVITKNDNNNTQTGLSVQPENHSSTSVNEFTITKRNLPHWQNPGSLYFITFRTYNKLELDELSKQIIYDAIIYQNNRNCKIYSFVVMPDHVHIILQPLEISSNKYANLSKIMQSIKGYSAKMIIKELRKRICSGYLQTELIDAQTGTSVLPEYRPVMSVPEHIFQAESFDRIIRNDDEMFEKMNYILNNPVKKGLIENGYNYKWYYLNDCPKVLK